MIKLFHLCLIVLCFSVVQATAHSLKGSDTILIEIDVSTKEPTYLFQGIDLSIRYDDQQMVIRRGGGAFHPKVEPGASKIIMQATPLKLDVSAYAEKIENDAKITFEYNAEYKLDGKDYGMNGLIYINITNNAKISVADVQGHIKAELDQPCATDQKTSVQIVFPNTNGSENNEAIFSDYLNNTYFSVSCL